MSLGSLIRKLLKSLPFAKGFYQKYLYYSENSSFPAGHFYSPVVLLEDVKKAEVQIWKNENSRSLPAINLNEEGQLQNLQSFSEFYSQLPFTPNKQEGIRYFLDNEYYSYADGIVLYSMLRKFNPVRIIEIGSGFSSALMLDVNSQFCENRMSLTFIEPYPDRLNSLLSLEDHKRVNIIQEKVQDVKVEVYNSLEQNDILFVDSSHVAKTGSDLNFILFDILPILKPGVLIHFHDIFYPFEYPRKWVMQGRNWNESYFLRAFLMNNPDYKIEFFTSCMQKFHPEKLQQMPFLIQFEGAGIWLRKLK